MSRIVCVFAHPDDESFGTGGTIATLTNSHEVFVICVTNGNHQSKNLKTTRASELETAAKILNIQKTYQFDFEDGFLSNALYHDIANQIEEILDSIKPSIIITFHPNGVSGHLDHIAVTSIVNFLFPKLDYLKEIWYLTHLLGEERADYFVYWPKGESLENINKIIDISPVMDIKARAIQAHESQLNGTKEQINRLLSSQKEYFLVRSKGDEI